MRRELFVEALLVELVVCVCVLRLGKLVLLLRGRLLARMQRLEKLAFTLADLFKI